MQVAVNLLVKSFINARYSCSINSVTYDNDLTSKTIWLYKLRVKVWSSDINNQTAAMNIKQQFQIFKNNPWLVYLDSASSTQKPDFVVDKTSDYISNHYANIGRWQYRLAELWDEYYYGVKQKIAELTSGDPSEIFFTYNATYGINIVALSLIENGIIKSWDEIVVGVAEHHANILVRQHLSALHNIGIKYLWLNSNLEYDIDELKTIITYKTKLVTLSLSSNVLGNKNNLNDIKDTIWQDVVVCIDGSQAIPHYKVDLKKLNCDIFVWSAHKFFAYTGLGIVHIKKSLSNKLNPIILGGGIVDDVNKDSHKLKNDISKREPGTPNIISIVSLYNAIVRRGSIWWYDTWERYENKLIKKVLERFEKIQEKVKLVNPNQSNRIWIFAFELKDQNHHRVWELLDQNNICVRVWWHCAYPLHQELGIWSNIRLSLHIYNDEEDIDKFFDVLESIV